jgi:negative regulator of sigma E activity
MNQAMNERLSALSDGELRGDEVRFLLRGIAGAPGPLAAWGRYQLVRICLRRGDFELPPPGSLRIAACEKALAS